MKLAKLAILYLKLGQEIGYITYEGEHCLGNVPKGKSVNGADCNALLNEFEQIIKTEKITHFAEGPSDVEEKIRYWKETLATSKEGKK